MTKHAADGNTLNNFFAIDTDINIVRYILSQMHVLAVCIYFIYFFLFAVKENFHTNCEIKLSLTTMLINVCFYKIICYFSNNLKTIYLCYCYRTMEIMRIKAKRRDTKKWKAFWVYWLRFSILKRKIEEKQYRKDREMKKRKKSMERINNKKFIMQSSTRGA